MPHKLARRTIIEEPEPEDEDEEAAAEEAALDTLRRLLRITQQPTPLLYDVGDACYILGKISKQMLYRLIHLGQITPVKVGTRSMFTMDEMERFVIDREKETELASTTTGSE